MDHFPLSDSLIGSPPKCSISFPLAFAYPPPHIHTFPMMYLNVPSYQSKAD